MKYYLLFVILGIFMLTLSVYASECSGDLCCEGPDSGHSYWTGECANTSIDPSLPGKRCSVGNWVDAAVLCPCPSGYSMDTSDNEDGVCVEIDNTQNQNQSQNQSQNQQDQNQGQNQSQNQSQNQQNQNQGQNQSQNQSQNQQNQNQQNQQDNSGSQTNHNGYVYTPVEKEEGAGICMGLIFLIVGIFTLYLKHN
ncbi:hypothetical protein J7J26_02560 [Candidatus Micrarchaeota archaeon]|nr:hypothetical protein [Candidatus Micrarchaeota archaeon]